MLGGIMEAKISIEIQDTRGAVLKRVIVGVPENVNRNELIAWAKERYPDLLPDAGLSVLVDWGDNQPGTGRLVGDGSKVIIKPRTVSSFNVYEEK